MGRGTVTDGNTLLGSMWHKHPSCWENIDTHSTLPNGSQVSLQLPYLVLKRHSGLPSAGQPSAQEWDSGYKKV